MKKRNFLLLLLTLLIGICCLHYSCKPKKSCCELPAPDSFTATVISGDSVNLDWSPVAGAAAYRVTVKDITADTTLPQITTVGTDTLLTGLTPNHAYTAIVQAICGPEQGCPVSPNGAATCFTTRGVIVEDLVVMSPVDIGGTGMDDCEQCSGEPTIGLPPKFTLSFPSSISNPRLIFKLKITVAGQVTYFKLAFDKNCPHIMKGMHCPPLDSGVNFRLNGLNELEFSVANDIVKLTPDYLGNLAVTACTNCSIQYVECINGSVPWAGCQ